MEKEKLVAAICDNEKMWLQKEQKIIEEYAKKTFLSLETHVFDRKDAILSYSGTPWDVIFLDIEMGKDTGIEIAKAVNEKWPSCQVVFVTNFLYYATDVYATDHVFFVVKEHLEEKIGDVFQKILHIKHQKSDKLLFSVIKGTDILLCPDDILYFERKKRVTKIATVWGEYEVWDKLSEIMPRLSKVDFVRCHNSYIVYLPAVSEMNRESFLLKNDDDMEIPISRGYAKEVKQCFMKWAFSRIS